MYISDAALMHRERMRYPKEAMCERQGLNALIARARVLPTKKHSPTRKYSVVLSGRCLYLSMRNHFALSVMST